MAIYTPTIIVTSTPGIQVNMAGTVTYNQFLQSLGQFVYLIHGFILEAQSFQQLLQPISYDIIDADGSAYGVPIVMAPDPYQRQSVMDEETQQLGLVLNGESYVSFNLLAGAFLTLVLCTTEVGPNDGFEVMDDPAAKATNQDRIDDRLGELTLYKDFKLCIT